MSISAVSNNPFSQYPVGTVASPKIPSTPSLASDASDSQTSTSSSSSATSSTSTIFQQLQSFFQTRQADLKQLGSDLQSGNLSAAEQDFSALTALGQNGPFANSDTFGNAGREQDLTTIGQDLQSGNLTGAQAAFTALTAKPTATKSTTSTTGTDNASSIFEEMKTYRQERKADLAQLGTDLQAGNLTAALQDYNNLITLGQTGPNKNGQTYQKSDREQDLQAIGTDLQAGNLTAAESDFASLSGTFGSQAQVATSAYAAVQQTV